MLLGYTDAELANMGGYDLVHYDDLAYVASAHQECEYSLEYVNLNELFIIFSGWIHNKIIFNDN